MNQHHITVSVSRSIFAQNIRLIREHCTPAQLCVVVKSDAYGHGLKALAPIAINAGADMLGICTNPEASVIRQINEDIPLLRLRMALPEELDESLNSLNIQELVGSMQAAQYLDRAGQKRGKPVQVHLKVDTGMGRGGFSPDEIDTLQRVCGFSGLNIRGVMTHLASADDASLEHSHQQLDVFQNISSILANELPEDVIYHSHNSAATMRLPECRQDMVRVGAACFGMRTSQHFENFPGIKPVMSVKTRIAQVRKLPPGVSIGYGHLFTTKRPTLVASLPIGFGEGYPRSLFNKGIVLVNGQRCPVIGRVSLNITTVDVTDLPQTPEWGDEVVLFGDQGQESISFEEMADAFHSVHTEINLMTGRMNNISYID